MAAKKKAVAKPNPKGLAEALNSGEQYKLNRGGVTCQIVRIISEVPEDLREELQTAVDNPVVSAAALSRILTSNGYPIRAANISRHRLRGKSGGCSCPV